MHRPLVTGIELDTGRNVEAVSKIDTCTETLALGTALEGSDNTSCVRYNYTVHITELPCEILGAIFVFLTAPAQVKNRTWHLNHSHLQMRLAEAGYFSPIYLGHICSYLRDAAWNAAALWTYIDISPMLAKAYQYGNETDSEESNGFSQQYLQGWLDRSKELPLTIVSRTEGLLDWNQYTSALFRILGSVSHRWGNIETFNPYICAKLMDAGCSPLHALQEATLCEMGSRAIGLLDANATLLLQAPNLRKLQLCNFYRLYPVILPYDYLVDLCVTNGHLGCLLNLLAHIPNLRILCLYCVERAENEDLQDICVKATNLRSLTINAYDIFTLLGHIQLGPMLEDLVIQTNNPDIDRVFLSMRYMTSTLRGLSVNIGATPSPLFYQIFSHMQALTKLILNLTAVENVSELELHLGSMLCTDFETPLPYLQHIEFHAPGGPFLNILRGAKHRWRRGQILNSGASNMPCGVGMVAKIQFVGFMRESTERSMMIKEYVKHEIEEGMVVMFATWQVFRRETSRI